MPKALAMLMTSYDHGPWPLARVMATALAHGLGQGRPGATAMATDMVMAHGHGPSP